jgi:hypothetical protein
MIDRQTRQDLVRVIRAYLDEEITAFRLDDASQELGSRTDDATVHEVVILMWYHYDDLTDHKIVASKEEWDFFHRILLLLESDAEIRYPKVEPEIAKARRWSLRQPVAVCAIAAFMSAAFRVGWQHVILLSFPFGVVSMLLALWKSKTLCPPSREEEMALSRERALVPFESVSDLLAVRRQVPDFSKKPYPASLPTRRIRDPIVDKIMWLPAIMADVRASCASVSGYAGNGQDNQSKNALTG